MKRLLTLCILILSASILLQAQREETIFGSGGIHLTGLWGGSTNGIIKFEEEFSLNNGGFFAFEINNNFLIGWSGYGGGESLEDGRRAEIDGNDLLLGYTFQSNRSIHPAVYMKGGRGSLDITGENDDRVTVYEPSIGLEVNVFRFMRIGLEGGYRFVTDVQTPGFSDKDFSSPVVGLRLKFGWSWD